MHHKNRDIPRRNSGDSRGLAQCFRPKLSEFLGGLPFQADQMRVIETEGNNIILKAPLTLYSTVLAFDIPGVANLAY